ncbi:MAG: vitamin K epoxide reductase family protein, partial [Chloroflexota bacterium]
LLGWRMPDRRVPLLGLLFALSLSGALFSAYLVGVQRFVLNDFCSWCLVSAAAAMVLFGLTLAQVLRLPAR